MDRLFLGSSDVCYSKLELQRLPGHGMIAAPPVSLLGWHNDLLLLIHLHTHERLVKTLNHLTRSENHHPGVVVAGCSVWSRALRFVLQRSMEYLRAGQSS